MTAHCFGEDCLPDLLDGRHRLHRARHRPDRATTRGAAAARGVADRADAGQHRELPAASRPPGEERFPVYAAHMRRLHEQPVRDRRRPPTRPGVPIFVGTDAGGALPHGLVAQRGRRARRGPGLPPTSALDAACWGARSWLRPAGPGGGRAGRPRRLPRRPARGRRACWPHPRVVVLRGPVRRGLSGPACRAPARADGASPAGGCAGRGSRVVRSALLAAHLRNERATLQGLTTTVRPADRATTRAVLRLAMLALGAARAADRPRPLWTTPALRARRRHNLASRTVPVSRAGCCRGRRPVRRAGPAAISPALTAPSLAIVGTVRPGPCAGCRGIGRWSPRPGSATRRGGWSSTSTSLSTGGRPRPRRCLARATVGRCGDLGGRRRMSSWRRITAGWLKACYQRDRSLRAPASGSCTARRRWRCAAAWLLLGRRLRPAAPLGRLPPGSSAGVRRDRLLLARRTCGSSRPPGAPAPVRTGCRCPAAVARPLADGAGSTLRSRSADRPRSWPRCATGGRLELTVLAAGAVRRCWPGSPARRSSALAVAGRRPTTDSALPGGDVRPRRPAGPAAAALRDAAVPAGAACRSATISRRWSVVRAVTPAGPSGDAGSLIALDAPSAVGAAPTGARPSTLGHWDAASPTPLGAARAGRSHGPYCHGRWPRRRCRTPDPGPASAARPRPSPTGPASPPGARGSSAGARRSRAMQSLGRCRRRPVEPPGAAAATWGTPSLLPEHA